MRRRSKTAGKQSMAVVAVFLVLAAAAAVVAGYFLGRVVMQFIFSPSEPAAAPKPPATPPAPTVAKVDVSLPAITLHRVQVGAFGNPENAAALASEMQKKGLPAYVMGPSGGDAFYRVACGLYTNKDAANRMADSIKQKGYQVYVGKLEIGAKAFTLESTDQAYLNKAKAAYEYLAQAIFKQAVMWDNYQLNKRTTLKDDSVALETAVREHHLALTALTPPAGLSERHRALTGIYEALLRNAVELRNLMEKGATNHYVNSAMFFVEAVEKYVAHTLR
ncbi:MAG: SPOR domain-containing protein [Bacillota bacterium]